MEIKIPSSQHICPLKGEILNPFKTGGKKKEEFLKQKKNLLLKHGRRIQKPHSWAQHSFLPHPKGSDIMWPVISACPCETHPEGFQRGRVLLVLSNAELT